LRVNSQMRLICFFLEFRSRRFSPMRWSLSDWMHYAGRNQEVSHPPYFPFYRSWKVVVRYITVVIFFGQSSYHVALN
jgi:hypothetical protein